MCSWLIVSHMNVIIKVNFGCLRITCYTLHIMHDYKPSHDNKCLQYVAIATQLVNCNNY